MLVVSSILLHLGSFDIIPLLGAPLKSSPLGPLGTMRQWVYHVWHLWVKSDKPIIVLSLKMLILAHVWAEKEHSSDDKKLLALLVGDGAPPESSPSHGSHRTGCVWVINHNWDAEGLEMGMVDSQLGRWWWILSRYLRIMDSKHALFSRFYVYIVICMLVFIL
jgi:hypothetical protein